MTKPKTKRCKADGKKRYTYEMAVHAALYVSRRWGRSPRPYPCPDGGGWHLTVSRPDNTGQRRCVA